ncbi:phosphotransferase [Paenibacillus puldeungensis]|uniref:Phosphotransferase n=1 Tax=Paenibacillus puldeungensis TaxID=696536 RepID=A0ABW3S5D9_9BACL
MLSKIHHYNNPGLLVQDCYNLYFEELKFSLSGKHDLVAINEIRPGGTLGVFSRAVIDGKNRFIKTHMKGNEYRNNLLKEINILKALYGDYLDIAQEDIIIGGGKQTFLIMDFLESFEEPLTLEEVQSIIEDYSHKLSSIGKHPTLDGVYSITELYDTAVNALLLLYDKGLIENKIYQECSRHLDYVNEIMKRSDELVLSHGDLSNKNIMRLGNKPIIIDWEDCIIGVKDYDLCYWLTFFDQRVYYNQSLLSVTNIDADRLKALMIFVTILKCFLSYQNNTFHSNALSFDRRLEEILLIKQ